MKPKLSQYLKACGSKLALVIGFWEVMWEVLRVRKSLCVLRFKHGLLLCLIQCSLNGVVFRVWYQIVLTSPLLFTMSQKGHFGLFYLVAVFLESENELLYLPNRLAGMGIQYPVMIAKGAFMSSTEDLSYCKITEALIDRTNFSLCLSIVGSSETNLIQKWL